jgi:hypothetical protein
MPYGGLLHLLTHMCSVVAITGLGGHAFGSWRSRASTARPIDRPMWLRDFLPEEFANTRIMTYGYDSNLRNPNRANLTDYRRNFGQCLQNARRNCPVRLSLSISPVEVRHCGG